MQCEFSSLAARQFSVFDATSFVARRHLHRRAGPGDEGGIGALCCGGALGTLEHRTAPAACTLSCSGPDEGCLTSPSAQRLTAVLCCEFAYKAGKRTQQRGRALQSVTLSKRLMPVLCRIPLREHLFPIHGPVSQQDRMSAPSKRTQEDGPSHQPENNPTP